MWRFQALIVLLVVSGSVSAQSGPAAVAYATSASATAQSCTSQMNSLATVSTTLPASVGGQNVPIVQSGSTSANETCADGPSSASVTVTQDPELQYVQAQGSFSTTAYEAQAISAASAVNALLTTSSTATAPIPVQFNFAWTGPSANGGQLQVEVDCNGACNATGFNQSLVGSGSINHTWSLPPGSSIKLVFVNLTGQAVTASAPVTSSGTFSLSVSTGNAALVPVPIPVWALGLLGAGIVGFGLHRLRRQALYNAAA
jgi:hypothetical protein